MIRPTSIAFALFLAAGPSCGVFTSEEPCTLIGCTSGLRIDLGDVSARPVQVVIELEDGTVLEGQCSSGCRSITFEGVNAGFAVIRVYAGPTIVEHVDIATWLTYEEYFPNGEDCGPPCRIATVRVKDFLVPAGAG